MDIFIFDEKKYNNFVFLIISPWRQGYENFGTFGILAFSQRKICLSPHRNISHLTEVLLEETLSLKTIFHVYSTAFRKHTPS